MSLCTQLVAVKGLTEALFQLLQTERAQIQQPSLALLCACLFRLLNSGARLASVINISRETGAIEAIPNTVVSDQLVQLLFVDLGAALARADTAFGMSVCKLLAGLAARMSCQRTCGCFVTIRLILGGMQRALLSTQQTLQAIFNSNYIHETALEWALNKTVAQSSASLYHSYSS